MLNAYILDSETTGLDPKRHELIELSVIRYSDRFQFSRHLRALNPRAADPKALQVSGKSYWDLTKGDHPTDVLNRLEEWLAEDGADPAHRLFVGHNVAYDRNMLHATYKRLSRSSFPALYWLDTMALTRSFCKKAGLKPESFKLKNSLATMNVKPVPGEHHAKEDAQNTYLLYRKVVEQVDHLPLIKPFPYYLKNPDPAASLDDLE